MSPFAPRINGCFAERKATLAAPTLESDEDNSTMSGSSTFSHALQEGVLVFDGAMGTELYRHHVFTNRCFDELCLSDAKLIRQIHWEYCEAGADVLTTNTFGAEPVGVCAVWVGRTAPENPPGGGQIAREVANEFDRPVFVAGSIGPLPSQPQYEDQTEAMLAEQIEAVMAGGAISCCLETQPNRKSLENCAGAMRRFPDVPYMLSFVVVDHGESASGEAVERMTAPLADGAPPPIAWGMNCGAGPDGLLIAVEKAVRLVAHLVVQPNAGIPKEVDSRRIYFCSRSTWRHTPSATCRWARWVWAVVAVPRRSTSAKWPGQ